LGLIGGVIYRQKQRFEHEKQNLQSLHQHREAQHQLEAQRSEEAINQLKNEKLEAEIFHKTQELASVAMHLVQKNSILSNIQGALGKLQTKMAPTPDLEKEVGRIIKMMEQDARIDDDWEHFSQNFDQVHSDFLKRLSEKYSHLSPNDYRLCAYLRMNLSSKEIATLMNISLRGVEASRYRLRRRLNLDTEINLTDYLIRF
jgi:DNA-binding CsgD family transcriptional regulator